MKMLKQKLRDLIMEPVTTDTLSLKLRAIKSCGFITDKLLSDNYYELEIELYNLVNTIAKLASQINPQDAIWILENFQKSSQEPEILLTLVVQNLDSTIALLYCLQLIDKLIGLKTFSSIYNGIEALRMIRLCFHPEEYKKIWHGKPDTSYLYSLSETLSESSSDEWFKELIKYYPGKVQLKPERCCCSH